MKQKPEILILSQGTGEITTNVVMEYLIRSDAKVARVNGSDLDSTGRFSLRIDDGEDEVNLELTRLHLSSVKVVWFRRWLEPQPFQGNRVLPGGSSECCSVSQEVVRHLNAELRGISKFFFSRLKSARWFDHPSLVSPNKLAALKSAMAVGLDTPPTLVTTEKSELIRFAERCDAIISKPIGEVPFLRLEDSTFLMYTRPVDQEIIHRLPQRFFPTLFQEKIEKNFEIRVFYLDGVCYPAAIFSQLDSQTEDDFRNYNHERPNRVVPYLLADEVKQKLHRLMVSLGLTSGSLDLIRSRDGRLVFLEVNPVGQFGMISEPCNYGLEKKVAEFLCRELGRAGS